MARGYGRARASALARAAVPRCGGRTAGGVPAWNSSRVRLRRTTAAGPRARAGGGPMGSAAAGRVRGGEGAGAGRRPREGAGG
ncbi:hypothetical protein [Paenibacillus apis]|uniref:hypothetical protein n=1 Tax=Paenibacillus apis TaxID=1792174 RepID=UPI00265B36A2|nr:hypothetical protein [Paenibacillus apis]